MKNKIVLIILLLLIGFLTFPLIGGAEATSPETEAILQEQMEMSGANELLDNLPKEADDLLDKSNMDQMTPDAITKLSFSEVIQNVLSVIKEELTKPLRLFFAILGIILLSALIQTFADTVGSGSYVRTFHIVSILCICGAVIEPATNCIVRAVGVIQDCSTFMLSFIPIFAGIMTTSGNIVTASVYMPVMLTAITVISQIVSNVIVPLIGIFLGFCIVGSVSDQVSLSGLAKSFKNIAMWILGLMFTIFVGLLSVQSIVANATDTVGTKTAKFMIGSFIPIVGGTISEVLSSIQGCLGLIKSTVGAYGIIVCVFTFIPTIVSIALVALSLNGAATIGDMLGQQKVCVVLNATSSALTMVLAMIIFFALLMIVSTSIMLAVGFAL